MARALEREGVHVVLCLSLKVLADRLIVRRARADRRTASGNGHYNHQHALYDFSSHRRPEIGCGRTDLFTTYRYSHKRLPAPLDRRSYGKKSQ